MKTQSSTLTSFILATFLSSAVWAQAPGYFNFDGTLSNSGTVMANQTVPVEFQIYDSTSQNCLYYQQVR